jgi:hypothetical protein
LVLEAREARRAEREARRAAGRYFEDGASG